MIQCIKQNNQVETREELKMKNLIIATLLTVTLTSTSAQAFEVNLDPWQKAKLEATLTAAGAGGLIGYIAGGWRGALTSAALSGGLTFIFNSRR